MVKIFKRKGLKIILFSLAAVFLAYLVGAPLFSLKHINPITEVSDLDVPLLNGIYITLDNELVHGELLGKISENNLHPILLHICAVADGKVYSENEIRYLECPLSVRKETYIKSGEFDIKLLSGDYFLDVPVSNKTKQSQFPGRVRIHKGERLTVEMVI